MRVRHQIGINLDEGINVLNWWTESFDDDERISLVCCVDVAPFSTVFEAVEEARRDLARRFGSQRALALEDPVS